MKIPIPRLISCSFLLSGAIAGCMSINHHSCLVLLSRLVKTCLFLDGWLSESRECFAILPDVVIFV